MLFRKPEKEIKKYLESNVTDKSSLYDALDVICANYKIEYKKYNRNKDEDLLLFQFGQYDWGTGENIEFDFVRQLIRNESIMQIHITFLYGIESDYRIEKSVTKWLEENSKIDEWYKEIRENSIVKRFNEKIPKQIKIWMEDVE